MLFVGLAIAAPTFVAPEHPEVVALAEEAWEAATRCTGREAAAHREVRITIAPVAGGFNGRAHRDHPTITVWKDGAGNVLQTRTEGEEGLYWIELDDPKPRTIAHEIAHAWVSGGPPALVEGATDLLADCVAERRPKRFPPYVRRTTATEPFVDLRTWTNPDDAGPERKIAYDASARLMRAVAEVVPREQLWRTDWTWEDLDALLEGDPLAVMLAGGAEAQRRMLRDEGGDGLDGRAERDAGPDPVPVDRDGGDRQVQVEEEGGLRLPEDGTIICSGLAAGLFGARVVVEGSEAGVQRWAGARMLFRDPAWARPGESILLARGSALSARVRGLGLVPDRRCVSAPRSTVIGEAPASFRIEVERLSGLVEAGVGLPKRIVLWIGRLPGRSIPAVVVPAEVGDRVREDPIYAAALSVAYARVVQSQRHLDVGLVEALARVWVPHTGAPWLAPDKDSMAGWVSAASESGWREVLEGDAPAHE